MSLRTILLFLASCATSWACWVDIPLHEFIRESPVLVRGEIVQVDEAPRQKRAYDTGYIEVAEVLKNTTGQSIRRGDRIVLLMPARNNEIEVSTDLRYSAGDSGYWILRSDAGAFKADYPKAFQEKERKAEVLEALETSQGVKFELK